MAAHQQSRVLIRVRLAVRHIEVFRCSLGDYFGKKEKAGFQLEQHVILYGLGLLLPSLPSREAKGI